LTDAICPFFHQHPQILSDPFKIFTMTNTGPPPAATNKDQSAISPGSSSTPVTAANVPTSVNNLTQSQIDAENLLRTTRNDALRIRRDAGELNVPNDETMLSTNSRITTPPPTVTSHSSNLIQFASAFSQFSPNSQNQALNLINNNTSALPSKILFSASHELPALSSSIDFSYGIHPFIVTLAKNKVHIPLTLFTSNATRRLHTEATSLKQNTVYNSSGVKCHILDLSQFPEELKIESVEWHEAWQRYMTFQDTYSDTEVATRWREHYLLLSAHDDFRINFPAILRFDIAERTRYCINPRAFNKDAYLRHLESVKLEVMSADVRNATRELGQDTQASSSRARYQPYNRETSKFRPAPIDPKLSFRDRDTKSEVTRSAPLCLCCKRTGHKFSDCREDTTPAGVSTYSKYLDGKLTLRDNPAIIFCITFQLNSARRHCKTDHPSQHACSWCGSTDHGACARKCL
jgi:hypothetical protein